MTRCILLAQVNRAMNVVVELLDGLPPPVRELVDRGEAHEIYGIPVLPVTDFAQVQSYVERALHGHI